MRLRSAVFAGLMCVLLAAPTLLFLTARGGVLFPHGSPRKMLGTSPAV